MPGRTFDAQLLRRVVSVAVSAATLTVLPPGASASALSVVRPAPPSERQDRYSLANGCYGLRSKASGRFVAKASGGYRASAAAGAGAEPFRMQATRLGSYLLYGGARDFLAATAQGAVAPAARPSPLGDWQVTGGAGDFTISLPSRGRCSPSPTTGDSRSPMGAQPEPPPGSPSRRGTAAPSIRRQT